MAEKIFAPLGMKDSFFEVPTDKADRLATIYTTEDGKLKPLTRATRFGAAIPSPDSGLLSTASDLARFDQMMLNKGVLNGRRVLSAAAVEAMTVSYTGDMPAGYAAGVGQGLGFESVTKPLGMYRYTSIRLLRESRRLPDLYLGRSRKGSRGRDPDAAQHRRSRSRSSRRGERIHGDGRRSH
jgi:CubicO group peptidase (beta-lactamase class C family)